MFDTQQEPRRVAEPVGCAGGCDFTDVTAYGDRERQLWCARCGRTVGAGAATGPTTQLAHLCPPSPEGAAHCIWCGAALAGVS